MKKQTESTDEEFMIESWSKQEIRELYENMQMEGKLPIFQYEGEIYD